MLVTTLRQQTMMTMATPNKLDPGIGVAFLGPAGTYTHEAAQSWFGAEAPWEPVTDIRDVFTAVETGKADWGVVPVENSTEGSITVTLDAFAASSLQICAEYLLRIRHCLLATPAIFSYCGIKRIVSHPQSLGQCRDYLNKYYPGIELRAVSSNAEAARLAAQAHGQETHDGVAAIAGHAAARLYGLQIVAESIEDTHDNTTRFLLLGRGCTTSSTGKDKTSLLISAPNEPGTLFHALEPFHRYGVSLTKLETRPSRRTAWSFAFYVEFEGHVLDENVKSTLQALQTLKLEVKWLGSYPQAMTL